MLYTRGHRDMAAFTAQQTASGPPGQVFRYSSGDSNLLAASLRGMVGEGQYADYPWRALFEPLGITQACGSGMQPALSSLPRTST